MESAYPTPWQRVARAAATGTGLNLSAEDVGRLAESPAFVTRAKIDDEEEARCKLAYNEMAPSR
jgi:hypothetical protein